MARNWKGGSKRRFYGKGRRVYEPKEKALAAQFLMKAMAQGKVVRSDGVDGEILREALAALPEDATDADVLRVLQAAPKEP
jgi:hypothetical protein